MDNTVKAGDFVYMPCIEFYDGQKDVRWEVREIFPEDDTHVMWVDSGKGILTVYAFSPDQLKEKTKGREWNVDHDS